MQQRCDPQVLVVIADKIATDIAHSLEGSLGSKCSDFETVSLEVHEWSLLSFSEADSSRFVLSLLCWGRRLLTAISDTEMGRILYLCEEPKGKK